MPYRAMALVAASVMTLSGSALAQKIEPTPDSDAAFHQPGGAAKSSNRMGAGGAGKGAAGFDMNGPNSQNPRQKSTNAYGGDHYPDLRMGGGGGGKGAVGVTTVKGSNSKNSDRMGAGGAGKGSVQLNPQPEPPGRR